MAICNWKRFALLPVTNVTKQIIIKIREKKVTENDQIDRIIISTYSWPSSERFLVLLFSFYRFYFFFFRFESIKFILFGFGCRVLEPKMTNVSTFTIFILLYAFFVDHLYGLLWQCTIHGAHRFSYRHRIRSRFRPFNWIFHICGARITIIPLHYSHLFVCALDRLELLLFFFLYFIHMWDCESCDTTNIVRNWSLRNLLFLIEKKIGFLLLSCIPWFHYSKRRHLVAAFFFIECWCCVWTRSNFANRKSIKIHTFNENHILEELRLLEHFTKDATKQEKKCSATTVDSSKSIYRNI